MKKTSKTGLVRGLSVLIVLILALSLTLTSCADKTAQSKADEAKTAADEAQKSADDAKTAASEAKDKADKAEADAKNNADAIAKLPDEAAVAEAIKNILTEYVKGTTLDKDSIVTTEELKKFLTSDQTANAISTALTDYAKTETVLETLKGYVTSAKLDELKTEMNNATAAKLNDYITAAAADSKYMTKEAAQAAVNDVLAKMATKDELKQTQKDLETAKADLVQKIADAKTELTNAMNTGLKDQKDALEQQKKDLEAEIAAAKTELTKAVGDAKTELEGKIAAAETKLTTVENDLKAANEKITAAEKKITNLETELAGVKDRLTNVEKFDTRIKALEDLVTGAEGGLDAMIKDLAQALIDENNKAYNDATAVVIEKLKELDTTYDAIDRSHYSAEGVKKLDEQYNAAWITILRSLNAAAANKALDDAKTAAKEVPNLADEAFAKYGAIGSPILIAALTECENKEADSKAAIAAARSALDTARAAMGDDAVEKYMSADGEVNLETRVAAAEAAYATLEAAKLTAPTTQANINGLIPDKSVYEAYDNNADILALKANLEAAKTEFRSWVTASFAADEENVNIPRLVDMSGYDAAYKFLSETLNGTLLNNLREQIRTALFTAKYIDTAATPYNVNGTCLHSTLAALEAVKTSVDSDAAAADIVEVATAVGAEYTDLRNAIEYARKMTAKKAEAEAAGGLIEKIVALGEAKKLAYSACGDVATVQAAFTAWADGVDEANIADILGVNKTSLDDHIARAALLADAKVAADEINAKILACGDKITDMETIQALKGEVAAWLTTYAIVADSADPYYVAENYDLVNHAALEALYNTSKGKADTAVDDADATVLPKLNAVDTTGKILHQKSNIEAAEKALGDWLVANGLTGLDDIDATVLDTVNADKLNNLKTAKAKLDAARTLYDETLAAAKAKYEADKTAYYDAFNALTAYQLKNGETVKAAAAAATAWFGTYVDGALGIADLEAQGVVTGFAAAEYDKIVNAKTAYDATLAAATADADAAQALYDAVGTVNVYSYAKIKAARDAYTAWCVTYGVAEADYDNGTFESTLAARMKTLSANLTAAETEYAEKVAAAKAAADPVKGAVNSWSTANVTIYSYNDMKALRELYDAWSNTHLIGNSFADINDTELAAMETVYNKLVALETEFSTLKTAKKAETDTVKGLLNNLNKVVVLGDKAEIEAARAAYNAWLNGTNDKTKIDASKTFTDEAGYKCYEITDAELAFLTAAENNLTALNDAKAKAQNSIRQLDLLAAPGSGMSAEVIAAYIKLLLLTLAGKGESEKASNDPEAFVFSEAVEFMEKNLAENLKISEIAAHCNTSVTVLKRIFSKYSGVGIHKYFLKLKLKRASALLSDGRTVTETADILGFSDQGYFSKAFRRETGASPSELKASCFKKFK